MTPPQPIPEPVQTPADAIVARTQRSSFGGRGAGDPEAAARPVEQFALPPGMPGIPPILLEADEPSPAPVPPPASLLEPEAGELPQAYGTGRVLAAARDPHCLYVHWDLAAEQQRRYNSLAAHQHLVLRIHLDSLSGGVAEEIHVHPESQHWFAHVGQAGRTYVAQLGYYQHGHEWRAIATAEPTATPGETVAEPGPGRFATLPPEATAPAPRWNPPVTPPVPQPQPVAPIAGSAASRPEPPLERAAVPGRLAASVTHPEPVDAPAPIMPPPAHASPELLDFPRQVAVELPPGLTAAHVWDWTPVREQALAEVIEWMSVAPPGPSSMEALPQGGLQAGKHRPAEAPGDISSPGIVPLPAVSSAAGGEMPQPTSFWFNVNAELVIYGATEPDAQVTIGGRPIRLRPDGTFSYRFALPDGHYALPISATAVHGEMRHAQLSFARDTEYVGDVGAHPQDPALRAPQVETLD